MGVTRTSRVLLRNRNRLRWGDWPEQLRGDLSRLVALVDSGPTPVYLVGGLGLAVRSDSFYRNHADIDLAIDTADLPEFEEFLNTCSYRVVQAVFGMTITPWHRLDVTRPWPTDVPRQGSEPVVNITETPGHSKASAGWAEQARPSPGGGLARSIHEDLALRIQDQKAGRRVGRTGLMDLLPFTRVSGGLHMHGYGTVVPETDFFPAQSVGNSQNLLLPNAAYKWHLPRRWRRQRRDLAVLARTSTAGQAPDKQGSFGRDEPLPSSV